MKERVERVKVSKQIKQAMANAKLVNPHHGYEVRKAWLSSLSSFEDFKKNQGKTKQKEVENNEV